MNGERISSENRKAVEFAILFEAGTAVRNMDCMRKEMHENEIYDKYTMLIEEIEGTEFDSEGVWAEMLWLQRIEERFDRIESAAKIES